MPTFTPRPTADTFTWTHVIYSASRAYVMVGIGGGGGGPTPGPTTGQIWPRFTI